jgi:hypothetical protein
MEDESSEDEAPPAKKKPQAQPQRKKGKGKA